MSDSVPAPESGDFLFYKTEDATTRVRLLVHDKTVWMTQAEMAELFEVTKQNISLHVRNILKENELERASVVKEYLTTAEDGKQYRTQHHRLEMILAVGYRVRSPRGTQFRRWATGTLQEYLLKGFVLDDERLKAAETTFGEDYFEELLERVRDIRASERRFYQKITDIYATSVDYDPQSETTKTFFATVQNKLEWAITGKTAAEIIESRVDAAKPNLGLTTWKNAPDGRIRRTDVVVAKNYLTRDELSDLNRIVTMYLDFAEDQAKRRRTMTMAQWVERLDAFLEFNDRAVLRHAGKIQKKVADRLAVSEFEAFAERRRRIESIRPTSDFDRFVEGLPNEPPGDDET